MSEGAEGVTEAGMQGTAGEDGETGKAPGMLLDCVSELPRDIPETPSCSVLGVNVLLSSVTERVVSEISTESGG